MVQVGHGAKDLVGVEVGARDLSLQFGGEYVEQQFGIARRIDVTTIDAEQVARELARVGEIAVVHEHDAVGRIHVERLCLFLVLGGAGRGVAHVPQAHVSGEGAHVTRAECLAHLSFGFELVQVATLGGGDTGGVLSAMLQQQKGVVDLLVHRFGRDDSNDSTHGTGHLQADEEDEFTLSLPHRAPIDWANNGHKLVRTGRGRHRRRRPRG